MTERSARSQEILQEKRRQFRSARQPRLLVDDARMLPNRPLAPMRSLGYFFVTESLQEKQSDISFGSGQTPLIELLLDMAAEALKEYCRLVQKQDQ